jgi:thiamine biosynthesis lipoprotein
MRRAVTIGCLVLAGCPEQPTAAPPPLPTTPPSASTSTSSIHADLLSPPPEASAPAPKPFAPERVQSDGKAMGTHVVFAAFTTETVDAAQTRAAFDAALAEIKRIESLMTTWRPDSEVSKINAAAGKSAVVVGDETFAVIKESVRTSEISEGTFDITLHTLHGLWKFDEDLDPHPPTDKEVRRRLAFLGWRNIKLDAAKKSVMLAKPETQISLGGIAKGYAVDKAAAVLAAAGLTSFFVQAGGDLYAKGKKPDGSDWQAGIRDPRGKEGQYFAKIPLSDHAFSTAGDYERSYIVGGKRYHHIIDPRTGQPATACRSVTIWAPSAFLADAIDDAVFILGPEKGFKLVESIDGVAAVVVDAQNNVWISKRLQGKLEVVAPPTDGI